MTSIGSGGEGSERVAIALGSNLGDRVASLRFAVRGLERVLDQMFVSRVYETAPVHVSDQPEFLNACVVGATHLTPGELLEQLKALERRAGRSSGGTRFGPRALDLDLLVYGEHVIERPELTVPHPRMRERAFVLLPLSDIAAAMVVPTSGEGPSLTVGELAQSVPATGVVQTAVELEDS